MQLKLYVTRRSQLRYLENYNNFEIRLKLNRQYVLQNCRLICDL